MRDRLRNTVPAATCMGNFQWVLSQDQRRGSHDGIVTRTWLCCKNTTIFERRYPCYRPLIGVIGHNFPSFFQRGGTEYTSFSGWRCLPLSFFAGVEGMEMEGVAIAGAGR